MLDIITIQAILNGEIRVETIADFEKKLMAGLSLFFKYPSYFLSPILPFFSEHQKLDYNPIKMLAGISGFSLKDHFNKIQDIIALKNHFMNYGETLEALIVSRDMSLSKFRSDLPDYIVKLAYAHLSVLATLSSEGKEMLSRQVDYWHFVIQWSALFKSLPSFMLETLFQPFSVSSRDDIVLALNAKMISQEALFDAAQHGVNHESAKSYLTATPNGSPKNLFEYIFMRLSGDAVLRLLPEDDLIICMTKKQKAELSPVGLYQLLCRRHESTFAANMVQQEKADVLAAWKRDDLKAYYEFIACAYSEPAERLKFLLDADADSGCVLGFSASARAKRWQEAGVDRAVLNLALETTGIKNELLSFLERHYRESVNNASTCPAGSHLDYIQRPVTESLTVQSGFDLGMHLGALFEWRGSSILADDRLVFVPNSGWLLTSILRERSLQAQSERILQTPFCLERVICNALLGVAGFEKQASLPRESGWSTAEEAWIHWMINTPYSSEISYQADFSLRPKKARQDSFLFEHAAKLYSTHLMTQNNPRDSRLSRQHLRSALMHVLSNSAACRQALLKSVWMGEFSLLQNIMMSHQSNHQLKMTSAWQWQLALLLRVEPNEDTIQALKAKALAGEGSVRHAILYLSAITQAYYPNEIRSVLAKTEPEVVSSALTLLLNDELSALKRNLYAKMGEDEAWTIWARALIQQAEANPKAPLPAIVQVLKTRTQHRTLKKTGTYQKTKQFLFSQPHGIVTLGEADKAQQNARPI